jgi:hypothetical protein
MSGVDFAQTRGRVTGLVMPPTAAIYERRGFMSYLALPAFPFKDIINL